MQNQWMTDSLFGQQESMVVGCLVSGLPAVGKKWVGIFKGVNLKRKITLSFTMIRDGS